MFSLSQLQSRSRVLGALLILAVTAGCENVAKMAYDTGDPHPNIVIITIDTLRADVLGSYGYPLDTSPELDAIAEKGILFERAISQSSWTRPSYGALLTGKYPRSLGMYDEEGEILGDEFETLPELLQTAGYTTLGVVSNPVINSVFNMDQGFDTYVDSEIVYSWMKHLSPDKMTGLQTRLAPAKAIFDRAFELLDENANQGRPVYLQLNIMEMHEYGRKDLHLIREEFLELYLDHDHFRRRRYLQTLRQVSKDVASFIQSLSERPGWRNTLFVINSDHGEGLDSHPDIWEAHSHGRMLYESNVRVPLILYHPAWSIPPARVNRMVRLMDVMPTILDFVGAPVPHDIDGRSLMALFDGSGRPVDLPDYVITETEFRDFEKIGVYSETWKYFDNRDEHPGLNRYALQAVGKPEIGQTTDQIAQHQDEAARLRAYLKEWESRFPKMPVTPMAEALSPEMREQLEAIGYIN